MSSWTTTNSSFADSATVSVHKHIDSSTTIDKQQWLTN
jgi:hypothetical protein